MFTALYLAASNLSGMASTAAGALEKIGGVILILVVGYKALGHLSQDRAGAAIGVFILCLIPAAFLFDPTGMASFVKSTVQSFGG